MSALLPVWIIAIPLLIGLVELIRTPRAVPSARVARLPDSALATPLPNSIATVGNGVDVVRYLELQHAEIKALFAETLAAAGADRQARFLALRRLIATHEATEEELFHPEAERKLGARGHAIVVARVGEERAAATAITELERLALDSMEFEMALRKLQGDVERHATHEEKEEFPALSGVRSDRLPRVREVARALYVDGLPISEGQPMTRDIGPFMAMLNRARDLLAGNTSREGGMKEAPAAE